MDYTIHGILEARILEWVTVPFSRVSSRPRDQTQVSSIADSLSAEPQGKLFAKGNITGTPSLYEKSNMHCIGNEGRIETQFGK